MNATLTLGSLFDGIGGFPLAAVRNGIVPIWASEIEPFPLEVTKFRFPQMFPMGDITKLKGADLPPVDIITGGSPCQDLSLAGKRKGLTGERSGLFMEQIRIVKEMRAEGVRNGRTNEFIRPRYMLWENVPGAFSSCDGDDFRTVLEETCRIADDSVSVPRSPGRVWLSAGTVMGDQFSVAWRVLDAQYWHLAQRRKRIFLVADFGGRTAPKILFEQDSLFGNSAPCEEAGQGTAASPPAGAGDAGGCLNYAGLRIAASFSAGQGAKAGGIGYQKECAPTLKGSESGSNSVPSVLCLNDQGGSQMDCSENVAGTLRAQEHGHQPMVYENHGIDARYTGTYDKSPTVTARFGTGGNNVPLTITPQESYCIAGNIIDRKEKNGGNGLGCQQNISYTLTRTDVHCVFSQQRSDEYVPNDVVSTQSARQYKDATDLVCDTEVAGLDCRSGTKNGDLCGTLQAHSGGGYSLNTLHPVRIGKFVRRLTPLECERLMGFPDHWTDIEKASDSARYKALGNSVAIPCVEFVLRGIAYFLRKSMEGRDN